MPIFCKCKGLVDIFGGVRGGKELQTHARKYAQADSGNMMLATNKRDYRHAHPQGLADGCCAVIREGIQRDVNPAIQLQVFRGSFPATDIQLFRPDSKSLKTALITIMENMRQFAGRCLPVMDEQGKIQGLVTVFDIFKALLSTNPNISTAGKTSQSPPLA